MRPCTTPGDLSYAQGFAADWDVFGSMFEPAFTRWPLMVGTGNHERDWPGTGDAFGDLSLDSGEAWGRLASRRLAHVFEPVAQRSAGRLPFLQHRCEIFFHRVSIQ